MKNVTPLVSVIVPAYNAARFLEECLDSIRGQTHTTLEIIVVDDGSTDDTGVIAERHATADCRVRVLRQSNGGASAARNAGLAVSGGEFVTFFDADDVLYVHSIERRLKMFAEQPEVDVVYSDHQIIDAAGHKLRLSPSLPMSERPEVDLLICPVMGPQGVLLRRGVVDEIGSFNTALSHGEDWDYWIRLARARKRFFHLQEVLCNYRRHGSNITNQTDPCLDSFERMLAQYRPRRRDRSAFRAWRRGLYGVRRNWHWNALPQTPGALGKLWRLLKTSRRHPGLLTSFPFVVAESVRKRLPWAKARPS